MTDEQIAGMTALKILFHVVDDLPVIGPNDRMGSIDCSLLYGDCTDLVAYDNGDPDEPMSCAQAVEAELLGKAYAFEELDEKERDHIRQNFEPWDDWHQYTIEDFARQLGYLGFNTDEKDIHFSGFYSQGDGARFKGGYSYNKGWRKHADDMNEEVVRLGLQLQYLQAKHFFQLSARVETRGCYSHSNTMYATVERDGREVDDATDAEFIEICKELADHLYGTLAQEYDYQFSDENISSYYDEQEFKSTGERLDL